MRSAFHSPLCAKQLRPKSILRTAPNFDLRSSCSTAFIATTNIIEYPSGAVAFALAKHAACQSSDFQDIGLSSQLDTVDYCLTALCCSSCTTALTAALTPYTTARICHALADVSGLFLVETDALGLSFYPSSFFSVYHCRRLSHFPSLACDYGSYGSSASQQQG